MPVVRVTRATPGSVDCFFVCSYCSCSNRVGNHFHYSLFIVLPPGVTDDTPDFNREMVMLDIPDELFGNSFTMVTNISKIFGDLMMVCTIKIKFYSKKNVKKTLTNEFLQNSARRYAQFVQYFKPLLGKGLSIKGLYPPPPTTAAPITTETSGSSTESNDV